MAGYSRWAQSSQLSAQFVPVHAPLFISVFVPVNSVSCRVSLATGRKWAPKSDTSKGLDLVWKETAGNWKVKGCQV